QASPLLERAAAPTAAGTTVSERVEHLYADMFGAGVVMCLHSCGDGFLVAPDDQRIDQPVGTATGKVVLGEAEPPEVVGVVGQHEVAGEVLAGDVAGLGG